jgi:hypothetical protein
MSSAVPFARRLFLIGAATSSCSACVKSYVTDDVPSFVRTYMMKGADLHMTRADIEKIPYASIAVRMGDGAQALLILGRYDGDDLHWISADREVIVTRHGRVVKTYGLPQDLKNTSFLTRDPLGAPNTDYAASAEFLRAIDLEPAHQDGVLVRSRFTAIGSEEIDILGDPLATTVLREESAAPDLAWQFVNQYWIDPRSGYVWKSRQYAAPQLPPLEIIVYRRAATT